MAAFSVLIPVFNGAGTVARAIDSALGQTEVPEEVIVCNDGSTDETQAVLESYGDQIITIDQENRGLSAARNAALARACSDWVVLLDADDEWLPTRIEKTRELIESRPEADIITTEALIQWSCGRHTLYYGDRQLPGPDDQPVEILRDNFVFVSSAVRRKALTGVGGFEMGLPHDSEYATWVRIILSGGRVARTDEPLAVYHRSEGSLSSDRRASWAMILEVARRIRRDFDLSPEQEAALHEQVGLARRRLLAHDALDSLQAGSEDARSRLRAAAAHPGLASHKRVLFGLASLSPAAASWVFRHTPDQFRPRGP